MTGGYKYQRCDLRELAGLNTTNTMEHQRMRHEAEDAEHKSTQPSETLDKVEYATNDTWRIMQEVG